MTENRFIIQKSNILPNGWVITDTINQIVITFEDGAFNETQKATPLEDEPLSKFNVNDLAHIMQEIGAWAARYHSSKCFSAPYGFEFNKNDRMYLYRRKAPQWRLFPKEEEVDPQALASSLRKAAEWLIKGRWP